MYLRMCSIYLQYWSHKMLPWYCTPLFEVLLWAVLCKGCVGGFATGSLGLFFWKLFWKVCPFQGLGQVHSYFPLFIFFNSVAQNNSPYLIFYIQNTLQNLYHMLLFFCQPIFSPLGTSHFRDWYYQHYTHSTFLTSHPDPRCHWVSRIHGINWCHPWLNLQRLSLAHLQCQTTSQGQCFHEHWPASTSTAASLPRQKAPPRFDCWGEDKESLQHTPGHGFWH